MVDIVEGMNWRYAVKDFDPQKKLPSELLAQILEAIRLSPSSFGLQPWRFKLIEKQDVKDELFLHSFKQPQVRDCSHLVVFCTPNSLEQSLVDKYIRLKAEVAACPEENFSTYKSVISSFVADMSAEEAESWMLKQLYIALGVCLSSCAMLKVDASPLEGFDAKAYDSVLALEERGLKSQVLCALGYRKHTDKYAAKVKERFSHDELFF